MKEYIKPEMGYFSVSNADVLTGSGDNDNIGDFGEWIGDGN